MPLLRFIVVALVTGGIAAPSGALAEPLDKESCLKLQGERRKLLTREMQAALDHGPDWVKDHLDTAEIEKVREFLDVEAMIEFRCRGGGVTKPSETAANGDPNIPPLPDRNPNAAAPAPADISASQTVADSDKTAPPKTKATR
jgi:hypothetical protein